MPVKDKGEEAGTRLENCVAGLTAERKGGRKKLRIFKPIRGVPCPAVWACRSVPVCSVTAERSSGKDGPCKNTVVDQRGNSWDSQSTLPLQQELWLPQGRALQVLKLPSLVRAANENEYSP